MGLEQIEVKLNPDSMPSGSDLAVVNAARRSFGKRSDWDYIEDSGYPPYCGDEQKVLKPADKSLIEFLARGMTAKDFDDFLECVARLGYNSYRMDCNDLDWEFLKEHLWTWRNAPIHDTPFNHCFVSFEVQAPIFVHRHLVKTEYTLCSEFSRRYITDDVQFYQHVYREASEEKKQGSGGEHKASGYWQTMANISNERQLELYDAMLADGVSPEQARGQLPLDLMTSWTWSGTLGAMAKMCRERLGSDVQKETQYVAQKVFDHLEDFYPVSAVALVKGA